MAPAPRYALQLQEARGYSPPRTHPPEVLEAPGAALQSLQETVLGSQNLLPRYIRQVRDVQLLVGTLRG